MTGPSERAASGAERCWLDTTPGASRWLGRHGPIEVLVGADGEPATVQAAHAAAWARLQGLLAELVAELPQLRRPVHPWAPDAEAPRGPVAGAMWRACRPLAEQLLTPMAAVAGAVADALIVAYQRPGIARAWVNNGGDIALHLAPGQSLRIGLVADLAAAVAAQDGRWAAIPCPPAGAGPAVPVLDGHFTLRADGPVRGIATSGWRGRSHSLGIADAVTVLAATAAQADAAATRVANAVDVAAPGIRRRPASALRDDSDLGETPVTVQVPPLSPAHRDEALQRGLRTARALQARGLLHDAFLVCQQQALRCGAPPDPRDPRGPPEAPAAASGMRLANPVTTP